MPAEAIKTYDSALHLTVSIDVLVTFVTDSIFIIITLKLVGDVRTVITVISKWIAIVVVLGWVEMAGTVVLGEDSIIGSISQGVICNGTLLNRLPNAGLKLVELKRL